MRYLVSLMFVFMILVPPALADDVRYIKENFKVSIRVNAAENSEPTGFLTAGDQVTVTRTTGNWSYIIDEKGLEGWVQTAQLIDYVPSVKRVSALEADNAALRQEYDRVNTELERVRAENADIRQLLDNDHEQTKAYLELMKKTGGDLTGLGDMKDDYERIKTELAGKEARLQYLEDSSAKAQFYTYLRWFLSGAGVLLLGFLIGLIVKRNSGGRRYY